VPRCERKAAPAPTKPPASFPAVPANPSLDTSAWTSHEVGFLKLLAPPWFGAQPHAEGLWLWSGLVVDAPHGVTEPGEETRHWLRVEVRAHAGPAHELACQAAPDHFDSFYPVGATELSPADGDGGTIAGNKAAALRVGSHGYDERIIVLPLGPQRSATFVIHTVGDFLWPGLPPAQAKAAEQQPAIVKAMLDSVQVTRP